MPVCDAFLVVCWQLNWDCALRRVGTGRTHIGFRKPPPTIRLVSPSSPPFANLNRNVVFYGNPYFG